MEETKKNDFNIWLYIWKNRLNLSFFFSVLALALSIFNTYKITTNSALPQQGSGSQLAEKPEKILKELPKGVPTLGNEDAKLTIVEFADFQCSYCAKFHKNVYPAIKSKYIDTGKVKFVYMDYAFLGQGSKDAAEAAKCSTEQGKFWQYHDEIYNNQAGENKSVINKLSLEKFAQNIGLDLTKFNLCVSLNKYDKSIEAEFNLGVKYGVTGTPGFIIGKQTMRGVSDIQSMESLIDSQL